MSSSKACSASSRVSVMITPLPAASPSAFSTNGGATSWRYSLACCFSAAWKLLYAAVGIWFRAMNSFAKSLLPSSWAPACSGPKKQRPFSAPESSRRSCNPSTRGCSGPETIRSMAFSSKNRPRASISPRSRDTFSAHSSVPGFPGLQYSRSQRVLSAIFMAIACSLPPLPINRMFMAQNFTQRNTRRPTR